jgi:UDP-GlcNAc3NAcA epimerase
MLTILSIMGARPQFIKHAPLHRQLSLHCSVPILHTGQHYDPGMSADLFEELGIPAPDYTLDMAGAATQSEQTGRMMAGIEEVCAGLRPDAVLLYGDTNSTLAGALVAAKMAIPTIHVEAGIRSYNRAMPEEVNRIVADTFAAVLLCPVPQAVENLRREGISHDGVYLSGDVMCDMLEIIRPKIRHPEAGPYYFATIHRPYNTDDPERLRRILGTLNSLGHPVIFPLHPRTAARMQAAGLDAGAYPNISFIPPAGYLASISYQDGAACIITDSGGIQKEAYMLRKKCITLRSETEWNETLKHGWNTLVFEDIESIPRLADSLPGEWLPDMFGDGQSSRLAADIIMNYFSGMPRPISA